MSIYSVGQIAQVHDADLHQVEYVLRSRAIKPVAQVGNSNVYDDKAMRLVGKVLAEIRERRGGKALQHA